MTERHLGGIDRGKALEQIGRIGDQILGLVFLAIGIALAIFSMFAFRTLMWEGDEPRARFFLLSLIGATVALLATFLTAAVLCAARGRHLRLWLTLGTLAIGFYIFGFLWPFLYRVWHDTETGGLGARIGEHSHLLLTGGLLVTEFGPFIAAGLTLVVIRALVAYLGPYEEEIDVTKIP